ncbi:tyrosine-type recombinase/integrase [Nitratiruptor tergarcus]|uniref:tyrosine-type recombinase/integrase n=1 Tax=Nitratiruptor tergarcus TaxID=269259 RepID=UPI0013566E2F|nr:tyrosine-type recombinase/integrase [Nitratiruptor tergarcus]
MATKDQSRVKQRFNLPPVIMEQLLRIPDERKSYIFKSPIKPDQPIQEIKRQIKKVRKASGIEEYKFHAMRNYLVTALYEKGIPTPILSQLLGHLSPDTLKHYLSIDTYKASEEGNKEVYKLLNLDEFGL